MRTPTSPRRPSDGSRLTVALVALIIAVATIAAYAPGTRAPFYFDDTRIIVDDAALRWDEVSWQRARQTLEHATLPSRPVANLSLALNHAFGGLDPTGYHWTNIAIHLAVGGALAWLAWLVIGGAGDDRRWRILAVLTATGCFLLHPLNIQAVTYVVQRMAALAALFSLLALALYVSARQATARGDRPPIGRFVGAAACWALALASKENASTALPVALLYEWSFHGADWQARIGRIWRRGALPKLALLALPVLAVVALDYAASPHIFWGPLPARDFSGLERVLSQPRVHAWYLSALAWPAPSRLGLEHDIPISRSLWEPWTTLPAALLAIAVVGVLGWLMWRRRYPRVVWPLAAYVVFHSLESGPLSLELVFEHRMYLPMAALAIALAVGLASLPRRQRVTAMSVSAVVACALAVATYQRNRVWGDELAFWQQTVATAPSLPRSHTALGHVYAKRGRFVEAADELRRSLALAPTPKAHYNLGRVLYLRLNRRDEGIKHLQAAADLAASYAAPRLTLGMIAEAEGDPASAQRYLESAARIEPNDPSIHAILGRVYIKLGRHADAVTELEAANRFGVKDVSAYNNLGIAYARLGRRQQAVQAFQTALRLDPKNGPARENLDLLRASPAVSQ